MKCPNCGKEMLKTSRKLTEEICIMWDQIDGDSIYETKEGYRYKCTECNIKYNSLKDHWTIPKSITVDITDKQENCIKIICNNLNMEIPYIINKSLASKFISKYIDESKRIAEEYKAEFDTDDYIMWDFT